MEPCFPGESIHEFLFLASFVCINFALPIKLSFSEPMNFLPPSLPILFPVTLREVGQVSGWVCGVEMLTGVKPQEMEWWRVVFDLFLFFINLLCLIDNTFN